MADEQYLVANPFGEDPLYPPDYVEQAPRKNLRASVGNKDIAAGRALGSPLNDVSLYNLWDPEGRYANTPLGIVNRNLARVPDAVLGAALMGSGALSKAMGFGSDALGLDLRRSDIPDAEAMGQIADALYPLPAFRTVGILSALGVPRQAAGTAAAKVAGAVDDLHLAQFRKFQDQYVSNPSSASMQSYLNQLAGRQFYHVPDAASELELFARAQAGDPEAIRYVDRMTEFYQRGSAPDILAMPRQDVLGNSVADDFPLYITGRPNVSATELSQAAANPGYEPPLSRVLTDGASRLPTTPQYQNTSVFVDDLAALPGVGPNVGGTHYSAGRSGQSPVPEIGLSEKLSPADMEKALRHESQHGLMDADYIPQGFAGSTQEYASALAKWQIGELKRKIKQAPNKATKTALQTHLDALRNLSSGELYYRNPGEQLARIAEGDLTDMVRLTPLQTINPYFNNAPLPTRLGQGLGSIVADSRRLRDVDAFLERSARRYPELAKRLGFPGESNLEARFGYDPHQMVPLDINRSVYIP